ncbi:membrane protein [Microbacterium phage WilliamStrong]|nr:membrane protein [Microbacterium phage WilliamStrong]
MNWNEPWVPGFVTGSLALVAAVLTGIVTSLFAARRARQDHVRASATPGAPTVQQVWERQDKMERAFKASLTLLGEVVEQHADPGSLKLSKAAIKTLRDSGYMPSELEDVLTDQDPTKEK